MKPIRVMRIITRLNIGGPAVHVILLTGKFDSSAYENLLVCGAVRNEADDMAYYAQQYGVEPIVIPEISRSSHPFYALLSIWKLYRLIRKHKPDIVHTHLAQAGFVGRWAAWLARVPVIMHTFHGHVFEGYFNPLRTRLLILLEQMTARVSDTLITLTQGLRRDFTDKYRIARKERFTVLPLGLDLQTFAKTPRKTGNFRRKWGIPDDVPLVGIVGYFEPVKNHILFVEAAAIIHQRRPDAHFVLVGDGWLRGEIEAQVERCNLREVTTFTGWQRDVTPAYSDMDVFVISSVNEGTPVTVIEALATGCPVVATAVGGLPDLLDGDRFGRLVEPGNAAALAEGVMEVLDHPPDTGEAQKAMLNRYGIDRLVSDLDSLYRALLAKKRRG